MQSNERYGLRARRIVRHAAISLEEKCNESECFWIGRNDRSFLAIATSQTAFARSEMNCRKQWASYDVAKDGHLKGKEMKVFYADNRGEGNVVEVPESNMLKAAETMKVCAADHREILSQAHPK